MLARKERNLAVIKLDDGSDMKESLKEALRMIGIRSGIVLTGIGMLKNFEIGYYNGREYEREFHEEPHELVAMHGSIADIDGEIDLHIHVGLAGKDHRLIGGHLLRAEVCVINEISVLDAGKIRITRRKDGATGLNLLSFY